MTHLQHYLLPLLLLATLSACSDSKQDANVANPENTAQSTDSQQDLGYKLVATEHQTPAGEGVYPKELIYFFSYGCEHCNKFEPYFEQYLKNMPDWVKVRLIPIAVKPEWLDLARFYHALQQMGVAAEMKAKIFAAIHPVGKKKQRQYFKTKNLLVLAASNGLDADGVAERMENNLTLSNISQEVGITARSGANRTPSLLYDGRFLMDAQHSNSRGGILKVLDELIQQDQPK